MRQSAEYRWFNAYQAFYRAQNPAFKEYWFKVMQHLSKEFN